MSRGHQAWTFTLFHYTSADERKLKEAKDHTYIVWGHEVCPDTLRPHLQGYVEFNNRKRLDWLKRNVHDRAHWEGRKGTPKQASDYCKKDGLDVYEHGEISNKGGQGKRNDLADVWAELREGHTMEEVLETHPATVIRSHKGLEWAHNIMMKDRTEKPFIVYMWGSSGCGKTRSVNEYHPGKVFYKTDEDTWWFNNYDQTRHEVLCLDEFTGITPVTTLNRLLDWYPLSVPTKGGFVKFNSGTVYICSNWSLDDIRMKRGWDDQQYDQISRRIDVTIHITRTRDDEFVNCIKEWHEQHAAEEPVPANQLEVPELESAATTEPFDARDYEHTDIIDLSDDE